MARLQTDDVLFAVSLLKIKVHQTRCPRHSSLATEFGSGSCGDLKDCAHRRVPRVKSVLQFSKSGLDESQTVLNSRWYPTAGHHGLVGDQHGCGASTIEIECVI